MGDVHAYGNPHFSCSPEAAEIMAVTLVKAMCAVDPPNADLYRQNAKKLVADLAQVEQDLKAEFAPYVGLKVVTFHAAWEYFADSFGLTLVATIEPKPSITPSPSQMKHVIDTMKDEGVKVVIVETYSSYDQAKAVADSAGAQLVVLPDHVNGKPEADSYQNLFRCNIHKLMEAAKQAGIAPNATAASKPAATPPSAGDGGGQ
jgi:zinc/manganese transport system substrate-binding protein